MPAVDPEERHYQQKLDALRREALANTRALAAKWSETVGTLLGLLGASALVVSRDEISKLATGPAVTAGILLSLGILAAAAAVITAAIAAQGRFRTVAADVSAKQLFENETTAARRLLFASRSAVGASLALLAATVLVTWFGTKLEAVPAKPRSLVVTASSVTCGRIDRIENQRLILVDDTGKVLATVQLVDVTLVTPVTTCPS